MALRNWGHTSMCQRKVVLSTKELLAKLELLQLTLSLIKSAVFHVGTSLSTNWNKTLFMQVNEAFCIRKFSKFHGWLTALTMLIFICILKYKFYLQLCSQECFFLLFWWTCKSMFKLRGKRCLSFPIMSGQNQLIEVILKILGKAFWQIEQFLSGTCFFRRWWAHLWRRFLSTLQEFLLCEFRQIMKGGMKGWDSNGCFGPYMSMVMLITTLGSGRDSPPSQINPRNLEVFISSGHRAGVTAWAGNCDFPALGGCT